MLSLRGFPLRVSLMLLPTIVGIASAQIEGDPIAGTWDYQSIYRLVLTIHGDMYGQHEYHHDWDYLGNLGIAEIKIFTPESHSNYSKGYVLTTNNDVYMISPPHEATYLTSIGPDVDVQAISYGPNYRFRYIDSQGDAYMYDGMWHYWGNVYGNPVHTDEGTWGEVKTTYE